MKLSRLPSSTMLNLMDTSCLQARSVQHLGDGAHLPCHAATGKQHMVGVTGQRDLDSIRSAVVDQLILRSFECP